MGNKTITMSLSTKGINRAIKELDRYKQEILRKEQRLLEGLSALGLSEAKVRFTSAMYDGTNDVTVSLDKIENGYVIEAKGRAVAFIEFGAGVYYNSTDPYPAPRPDGIVGIAEYGQGKGKRRAWYYKGDAGTNGEVQENGAIKTRGNPAAMPMWYASEEMRKSILKLAREVFS